MPKYCSTLYIQNCFKLVEADKITVQTTWKREDTCIQILVVSTAFAENSITIHCLEQPQNPRENNNHIAMPANLLTFQYIENEIVLLWARLLRTGLNTLLHRGNRMQMYTAPDNWI